MTENIKRKIAALLEKRVENGATKEEAEAALRKAAELIAKSNFYFANGEEEKQFRRVCEIARDALKGAENDA